MPKLSFNVLTCFPILTAVLVIFPSENVLEYGLLYALAHGSSHGHNFLTKCGEDSLVWNQYINPVDAEVKFCKYRVHKI